MSYAGLLKIVDIPSSQRAVLGYEIFSVPIANFIGVVLPLVEIGAGVLLIIGLFTRINAVFFTMLLLGFIGGIVFAWASGKSIDCGCFGGGGVVAPEQATYVLDIIRDLGLLFFSIWLIVFPRSYVSLDRFFWPESFTR